MGKSATGASNLGMLSNKIYELLRDLTPEDRAKVMNSVAQLFGDPPTSANVPAPQPQVGAPPPHVGAPRPPSHAASQHGSLTAQQFFAQKAPKSKVEMLAVAARYRELHAGELAHTKEDFGTHFVGARQNFDRGNFVRDMKNAQHQAQLFNKGTQRGRYQLSYYGQQYTDALPDREAVKKLKRPGRMGRKKKRKAGTR